MKYFSEILNKTFNSVEELEVAEKKELEKQEAEKQELKKISNDKKALAKKVEEADDILQDAYNKYALAKENCAKILEEAKLEINELLEPAKKAIQDAQKQKYEAIAEFNKKYGVYSTIYTGDKAYTELQRVRNFMDDIFNINWF